ncbi:MAG TPA: SRPBCC domain-containing protein [Gemmatimonadaceae bacterium]|jgi:uncharacterized protein YndB with AHSA1/START domain
MPDILHQVGIKAPLGDVYRALATRDGLAQWWTVDTRGESAVGSVVQFRFGEKGGFDMNVTELDPSKRVLWKVVDGPEEWVGTTIRWDLRQEDEWVKVLFKHQDWREPVEFMHHCSTKWATFLMSLKSLLETGNGAPSPHDVKIDNWN